ncbi:MAG TPA: TIGR04282 family arsenosugar biosynthesis glycosyltransferase [Tepidisphaeraceae bacterium]|nr:TIGR04282 family arsenosugar biosynthesis glycosyltransferase [Tepidisphaeraceae bacterium]
MAGFWKIIQVLCNQWFGSVGAERLEWLVVFARFPQPGLTKTRLIAALGPEGAAALQHRMTLGLLQHARRLRAQRGSRIVVCFAGGDVPLMQSAYGKDLSYRPQNQGDLGERLSAAFADAFSEEARSVVAVGSDCPALTDSILAEALDALSDNDVVLGPATDGGYYLIGLRRLQSSLFQAIDWGTSRVLEQTLHAAREGGLSVRLLGPLEDVDRPEDLVHHEHSIPR